MLDIIKKSLYLGLGVASVTKEHAESLVDELIEKGQLSKDEKSKAIKDIFDKIEKEEKEVQKKIQKVVKEVLDKVGVATQKDIENLQKRIKKLEAKLAEK
jgi:polyhydroxyalkanoate synthesis regulator phasin